MKNKKLISMLPLETERLIIKATSIHDIDMILKMDKQEVTQKFLGGIKNKTREERIKFLENKANKFKDNIVGSLTVYLKEGNVPIGFTGLSINEDDNYAEISYIYDEDFTGNGYCTEACRRLIEVAFEILELNRIFADTIEGNVASTRVLEKLNFNLENVRKNAAYVETLKAYRDFYDYILKKEEYKKL